MSEWWMQTLSGQIVDVIEPEPPVICLEDIAHALAMQCRFNGHVPEFYSVAQHSLLVAQMVPNAAALLHDAAEAYLGDAITPVKRAHMAGSYRVAEARFGWVIRNALGLPEYIDDHLAEMIRYADRRALAREALDLLHIQLSEWGLDLIEPAPEIGRLMSPFEARDAFLRRAREFLRKDDPRKSTNPRMVEERKR